MKPIMFEETPELPETVHLFTESLLSKWGFHDGEQLDWLRSHHRGYDRHAVLIECVKRKILPALKQRVEIRETGCSHNPCRAGTVDGVDVTHLWYDPDLKLDPPLSLDFVVMTGAEIVAIAEELRLNSAKADCPATACSLIAAGATNIMCDGTTMGPHAHTMLFQNLRGEFGKDARDPSWFNAGFPFRIWRESGPGYVLGRNRPCHTLDGQARTPEEAVEMAGSHGVIVTANIKDMPHE